MLTTERMFDKIISEGEDTYFALVSALGIFKGLSPKPITFHQFDF